MYLYLHIGGRQVLYLTGFYLAFLNSSDDAILQGLRGFREGYLSDDERLLVDLLDLRAHLHRSSPLAVIVFRHVDGARGGEVWV